MANLKEKYTQELRPALQEELGINNVMAVPKLTKIVKTGYWTGKN